MFQILEGDVTAMLRTLADASVDAVVTDPPYGLEFMGKEWDAPWKTDRRQLFDGTLKKSKNNPYSRSKVRSGNGSGYGADEHVMQALGEWHYAWAVEALRVLKPGGHLLAFGGSRTYHRLACAIEDAGFEIRDQIMWIYGSGFPKSLDVSKAIDKAGGKANYWFASWLRQERERIGMSATELAERGGFYKNINHGGLVVNWELGYGTPTAKQFNKVCEILNLPFERLEEVEREVIGRRKVHKGRAFTSEGKESLDVTSPATRAAKQWAGFGTALKPAHEPIVVARKPLIGTVAANVLEYGTGALNIDGCRVGPGTEIAGGGNNFNAWRRAEKRDDRPAIHRNSTLGHDLGRWPANVIHDGSEEVVSLFPESTSGAMTKPYQYTNTGFSLGAPSGATRQFHDSNSGSAARFFYQAKQDGGVSEEPAAKADACGEADIQEPEGSCSLRQTNPEGGFNARPGEPAGNRVYKDAGGTNFAMKPGARRAEAETPARFFYCAKADREERNAGLHGLEEKATVIGAERHKINPMTGKPVVDIPRSNVHPTVKPVDLMAYLCRLVTPPGGTVLDCFMGSGSTGIAALREGFNFIGIEIDAKYVEIARRRIEGDAPLFNTAAREQGAGNRKQGTGNGKAENRE